MAAGLEQKTASKSPLKHDIFVEQQLDRVRGRIRALDAGHSFLLLVIVTLGYATIMGLVDRSLKLSMPVRLGLFSLYAVSAGYFLIGTIRSLWRQVNAFYAAKVLEDTLPNAKNSVVNWLDLREEKLPPVILTAVGTRAARELKRADPEKAVPAHRTWVLTGLASLLLIFMLTMFVVSPHQFLSVLGRAFAPFRDFAMATRANITLVEPQGGDVTVPPSRSITFRVRIEGRFPALNLPGSPRLQFRYNQEDAFAEQPLDQDLDGTWYTIMPADQVINGGLWYKIAAGDAETREYLIKVVPIPQIRTFAVAYHYRPYLRKSEQVIEYPKSVFPGLHGPRGTEVELSVRANCAVEKAWLNVEFDGKSSKAIELPAEISGTDADTLRFPKFVLDRSGSFKILFTSRERLDNVDRSPFRIEVFADKAPVVELTQPGQDVQLPANGILRLAGFAQDDFGIKKIDLRMQLVDQETRFDLAAKPYRPGKSFRLDNGGYPDFLAYQDFVALGKLNNAQGTPVHLAKDMVIEYWLEAVDNCDYPDKNGNVGKSRVYKVLILDPEKNEQKIKQDQQQAQNDTNQHQSKQDKEIAQRNQADKQNEANNKQSPEDKVRDESIKKRVEEAAKKLKDAQQKEQEQNAAQPDPNNPAQQPNNKNEKGKDDKQKKNQNQSNGQGKGAQQSQEAKSGKNNNHNPSQAKSDPPKSGTAGKNQQPNQGKNDEKQKVDQKNKSQENQSKEGKNEASSQAKKNDQSKANGNGKEGSQNNQEKSGQAKDRDGQGGRQKQNAGEARNGGNSTKEKTGQAKNGNEKSGQASGAEKKNQGKEPPVATAKQSKDGPKQSAEKTKQGPTDSSANAKNQPGTEKSKNEKGTDAGTNNKTAQTKKKDDPGAAKNNPQGKDDGSKSGKTSGADEKKLHREPTAEEIARLIENIRKGNTKVQEQAKKELDRIAQEAKDPNLRQAAEEALRKAGKNMAKTNETKEGTGQTTSQKGSKEGSGTASNDPGKSNASTSPGEDGTSSGNSKSKDGKALAHSNRERPGGTLSGQSNMGDDPKAQAPKAEFAKRSGNLSLEDLQSLIRKVDPSILKRAGMSDKEWQQFLKDAQVYENMIRREKNRPLGPDRLKGSSGALPSVRPGQVGSNVESREDPLQADQAQPPPEFREAYRAFTSGQKKK
jgi:collagen type III alpha